MQEYLLKKVARDLSPQEAFNLLIHHIEQGDIKLADASQVKVDARGNVVGMRVNQNIKIKPTMAGVDYVHTLGDTRAFSPKPEFAIMLYPLALWLSEKCGVVKIVWGGIGSGSGKNAVDCHSDGRCIDFYGAKTAGGRYYDVDKDWWQKSVMIKAEGKEHPLVSNDRWGNDRKTFYRLAASVEPLHFWPGWFFSMVYEFAMKESTVSSGDISVEAFRRGDELKAGAIYHPDHPIAGSFGARGIPGRRTHFQHMHFGVGKAIG